jgi:hypothetical protein
MARAKRKADEAERNRAAAGEYFMNAYYPKVRYLSRWFFVANKYVFF